VGSLLPSTLCPSTSATAGFRVPSRHCLCTNHRDNQWGSFSQESYELSSRHWKELEIHIMSQHIDPPDSTADALAPADIADLEQFRRSPHPYLRHKDQIRKQSPDRRRAVPPQSHSPPPPANHAIFDEDERKRRKRASQSPSESGTEADDEGYTLVKALPAPPLRPHKGLYNLGIEGVTSPLLTPSQIDDEGRTLSQSYFNSKKRSKPRRDAYQTDEEARAAKQRYLQRRRNELVRRTTETALLAGIGVLAFQGCGCWGKLLGWHRGQRLSQDDARVR
jgi:hypothetical protein